jgi:hypothetical protein
MGFAQQANVVFGDEAAGITPCTLRPRPRRDSIVIVGDSNEEVVNRCGRYLAKNCAFFECHNAQNACSCFLGC